MSLWAKASPQPALATGHALRSPQPTVLAAPAGSSPAAAPPVTSALTQPNGLPILNSLPNAPAAIYLDFDGDSTTGTTAYSEDSDGSTFNQTEQDNITEAWRQISIYFAMYDVNVTTDLPSVPKAWHATGNNISGGYAYVGTFPSTYPRGFNQSSDARTRQSGIAHELGHIFGLSHQSTYDRWGTKTAEYASALDSLHGPLMGVDYSGNVHKWIIGHPSGSASSLQDDMAVIANRLKSYQSSGGDGYRADDFGNTIGTATPLSPATGGAQTVNGIIERLGDIDSFSFTTGGGTYSIAAIPDMPSGADLRIEVYDSVGKLLAASDDANNAQQISMVLPTDTYTVLVAGHGNYGDVGAYQLGVRVLPESFSTTDFAPAAQWGTTAYDSSTGVITNSGSGADVSGTSDGFHFAYKPIVGDTTLITRVTSIQNTASWAKAGLEIRETIASNSRHVGMVASYSNSPQFLWRSSTGGSTSSVNGTSGVAFSPVWLKLVRAGNVFTGYKSADGATWTQVGQTTVTMASTVYVGLLTSARNNAKLNVSTFESLSITGAPPASPIYNTLAAPENLSVTQAATGTGLVLSWESVAGAIGYAIERSFDGINWTSLATVSASVLSHADSTPTTTRRHFYRVSANDASGRSIPSSAASALNRPIKPPSISTTSLNTSTLVINWKDSDYETGYRVERSSDGGATYTTLTTLGANVPSYSNSGLSAATTYTYRITPLSATGDGVATTVTETTRLPATTGLAFDSVTASAVAFHWNAVSGATGYRIERSIDGTTYTTLANVTSTSHTDNSVSALAEYYYRVIATSSTATGLTPTSIFASTPSATALPSPWTSSDIGSVGGAGAAGLSGSTYTILASGSGIGSSSDSLHFVYQPLLGDGSVVARVNVQENSNASAKAGVMIRASLAAGAANVMMAITPTAGAAWQSRSSTNGSTTTTNITGPVAPYWVRLVRVGNDITGSYSSDGNSWTVAGTRTISMSGTIYIGLANSAVANTLINRTTFTNVTVGNNAPTVATAAAASPSTVTATTTALSVLGADDHGEANLTYTWNATSLPQGVAAPTFSANGTNAARNIVATFSAAGSYQFTVTMTDSSGLNTSSMVNVTVTATPTTVTLTSSPAWVATSATVQLSASVFDQFGRSIASPAVTWSKVNGGGTVNSSGVFTAPSTPQTSTVKAVSGSAQANVTVNSVTPPTVTTSTYELISWPPVLRFTFDRDVAGSLATSDVSVVNLSTGGASAPQQVAYDVATLTAQFTLPWNLEKGNYRATLASGAVSDSHNIASSTSSTVDFYVLHGDVNGDRLVDLTDLAVLAGNYGMNGNWAGGDFTGDGIVDLTDLALLAANYGYALPAPSEPVPAAGYASPEMLAETQATAGTSPLPSGSPLPVFSTKPISAQRPNKPIRLQAGRGSLFSGRPSK